MSDINLLTEQLQHNVLDDNKTILITITNYGYILYTLNMLKSLKQYDVDKKVLVICIDTKSYNIFKKIGYNTICINDNTLQKFTPWNTKGYDKICYIKLATIHKILSLHYNIVLIDGDIVFLRNPLNDILYWSKNDSIDIWIQTDKQIDNDTNMCTGYMFVKSHTITTELFDCISIKGQNKYKQCALDNNDQTYFNKFIKPYCKIKGLSLELYPNGNYFYNNSKIKETCTLVHFNWVHGHEKLLKIKEYNLWLLTENEEDTFQI